MEPTIDEIQGQEQWESWNSDQALEDEIVVAENEWEFEKSLIKMKQKENWQSFIAMLEA